MLGDLFSSPYDILPLDTASADGTSQKMRRLLLAAVGLLVAVAAGMGSGDAGANATTAPISGRRRHAVPPSHVRHERQEPQHADGWVVRRPADPAALLPMRIGLRQPNVQRGHDKLMDM